MNVNVKEHKYYQLVESFDKFEPWVGARIDRDIRQNRMGMFSLAFYDAVGTRVYPDSVKLRQKSHDFKFGCSLFLLDQFEEPERNAIYREKFANIFNCGVVPLYWNTLEPEKGRPRFEADSPKIWRRPPLDLVRDYCREQGIRMKGHCLAYNAFNPTWLPKDNRSIKMELIRRVEALAERYRYDFEDLDVINEMYTIYKNCYRGNSVRDLQITDEPEHEKFCFDLAKRAFPCSRLFWNEGCFETFGEDYRGPRSRYHLMLRRQLEMGTRIEGVGMQFHAFSEDPYVLKDCMPLYNSLRTLDVLDCYSAFGLPIHLSEVSIPSWSNDPLDEALQAEILRRMLRLWFSQRNMDAVIWWNLVDGAALGAENAFHGGLLRCDMSPKPAYTVYDELVNHVWHTEHEGSGKEERFLFEGYHGIYEAEIIHEGKRYLRDVRLCRDTTGYDNRLADWRVTRVEL